MRVILRGRGHGHLAGMFVFVCVCVCFFLNVFIIYFYNLFKIFDKFSPKLLFGHSFFFFFFFIMFHKILFQRLTLLPIKS